MEVSTDAPLKVAFATTVITPLDLGVKSPLLSRVAVEISAGALAVAHTVLFVAASKSPHSLTTDLLLLSLDGKTVEVYCAGLSFGITVSPEISIPEREPVTPARLTVTLTVVEASPIVAVMSTLLLIVPPSSPITRPLLSTTAIVGSALDQTTSPVYAPAGSTFATTSCVVSPSEILVVPAISKLLTGRSAGSTTSNVILSLKAA